MDLIYYPDKILREKCEEVKEFDQSLDAIVLEMFDIIYKKNGAGLAAPQVGIKKRIIAIFTGESPIAIINPKVIKKEGSETKEEGCLSFPKLFIEVKRAKKIKVEGQNIRGKKIEIEADGICARVLQHEIDHLEGILFIDRVGFFKRRQIKRKLGQISKL